MIKKELPSGAKLEINLAPFADANALYKAAAKELKSIKVSPEMDVFDANFIKDIGCSLICSDEITNAVMVCVKRCTYNGLKIDSDTFESEEARGDYTSVLLEVAKENLIPFLKGLYVQYQAISKGMKKP